MLTMQKGQPPLRPVDIGPLPDYPIDPDARLDSHGFIQWEYRRWLSSDMRWHGDHECKSMWFELINLAHGETPVGTLPRDMRRLARMIQPAIEPDRFERLCALPYGPLHGWEPCQCGDDVRLMHPVVLRVVQQAFSSRANHAARSEAASHSRRLQRLTKDIYLLSPRLGGEPRFVRWIDRHIQEQLVQRGGERRRPEELHAAIQACLDAERQGKLPKPVEK
jgi:hypothetical protein